MLEVRCPQGAMAGVDSRNAEFAMYQKILVPIDGSETSMRGLDEAIKIAKSQGSQLRLFHVVNEFVLDYSYGAGLYGTNVIDSLREAGKNILQQAEALVRQQGIPVDGVLLRIHRRSGSQPDRRTSQGVAGGLDRHGDAWAPRIAAICHGERCRGCRPRSAGAGAVGPRRGQGGQRQGGRRRGACQSAQESGRYLRRGQLSRRLPGPRQAPCGAGRMNGQGEN